MVSRNPDELREALEGVEFEGNADTLAMVRTEANRTVERQLATLADIDDKAIRILRLNVLLVGVVVSALSIASQLTRSSAGGAPMLEEFRNPYVELGIASLVLSTALAAITYSATEYDVGVSADNAMKLLAADLPAEKTDTLLVKNYVARVNFNRSTNVRNIPLVTATIVFAVVGVVLLTLGTYQATLRPVPWWLATGALLVMGAVILVSGLVTQTRRAVQDVLIWR